MSVLRSGGCGPNGCSRSDSKSNCRTNVAQKTFFLALIVIGVIVMALIHFHVIPFSRADEPVATPVPGPAPVAPPAATAAAAIHPMNVPEEGMFSRFSKYIHGFF